ncbi:hypothetical protein [Lactiplantibacillus plantarum]|uniref:hypothetical protein n=1 Tax=Lactiplantibacillus plantarum TaxID=1590 RepID=UPI001BAD51F9|nr:hypothetical protein [Lactiplantibacillus plantarum]MBS0937914.1 hypothetical protein [Lactiplantibacillus plantarum]MBS0945961.1 hypothetical protein [Lactiplantibacillus plantarum]
MNPEAVPETLTTDQLKGAVWIFFAKYSIAGDSFDIDDLLTELEDLQTEPDEDLDAKWRAAIASVNIEGKVVTLEPGLAIALAFFNLIDWDGDLAIKTTLQNKLTQRGLDGNLNPETVTNWEDAWSRWNFADAATAESWALNALEPEDEAANATFEDGDDSDEDEEEETDEVVKPAWKVGMSYATVFIVFRIIMWAMVSPGHLPALALAGEFSNKWMLIGVSLLLMFIAWVILTIIVTLIVLLWRLGKK